MPVAVNIERVYDFKKRKKKKLEYAVLVDRVWPRGISKDQLDIDEWSREIAPSTELRKWFAHDPGKWEAFKGRYHRELKARGDSIQRLKKLASSRRLILLFSAKDAEHNQAVALKEFLSS